MSRRLSRRLADALCAFRTGHSLRDLERVQTRRLILLGRRMAGRLRSDARSFRGDFLGDMVAERREALANETERLVHALAQPGQRAVAAVLLHKLQIDRANLYAVRVGQWRDVRLGCGLADDHLNLLRVLPSLPGEGYGKLLEGLVEHRMLDAFQKELGFCIWPGHRILLAFSSWRGSRASGEAR